jgi:hypothetical protein
VLVTTRTGENREIDISPAAARIGRFNGDVRLFDADLYAGLSCAPKPID